MITVSNLNTVCGNLAVGKGAIHLNTVNVDLCGICIQTGNIRKRIFILISVNQNGSISYCRRKIQNIACCGDYITLYKSGISVKINLVKHGIFSVVNCIGVVNGKAVKIIGVRTVDGTVAGPKLIVLGSVGDDRNEELTLFSQLTCRLTIAILLIKLV